VAIVTATRTAGTIPGTSLFVRIAPAHQLVVGRGAATHFGIPLATVPVRIHPAGQLVIRDSGPVTTGAGVLLRSIPLRGQSASRPMDCAPRRTRTSRHSRHNPARARIHSAVEVTIRRGSARRYWRPISTRVHAHRSRSLINGPSRAVSSQVFSNKGQRADTPGHHNSQSGPYRGNVSSSHSPPRSWANCRQWKWPRPRRRAATARRSTGRLPPPGHKCRAVWRFFALHCRSVFVVVSSCVALGIPKAS
jgi:hypothetical protein